MGWKLKALALFFGLLTLASGAWFISIPLFVYAFSGIIFRRRRSAELTRGYGGQYSPYYPPQSSPLPPAHMEISARRMRNRTSLATAAAGLILLLLSLVALAEGGAYSPIVFGGLGLSILLGRAVSGPRSLGALTPSHESIVMRRRLDPIHWFAVAEVKLATSQVGRALGGVRELVVIAAGETPAIYVVLKTFALGHSSAEAALIQRLGELTRISGPLGAYILPLDAEEGVSRLAQLSFDYKANLDLKSWLSSLSTGDYDILSLDATSGGYVSSFGAFRMGGHTGRAMVPPTSGGLSRRPLLWEVFREVGKRVAWAKPDGYTSFLASLFATRGESISARITEEDLPPPTREPEGKGDPEGRKVLALRSLGTPAVQISRVQLRAIASIYA